LDPVRVASARRSLSQLRRELGREGLTPYEARRFTGNLLADVMEEAQRTATSPNPDDIAKKANALLDTSATSD